MEIKPFTDEMSASPQISVDDLAEIAKQGYKSIICNRPDGEGVDQPTFAEIETAAHKHGLQAVYLPIVQGKVQDSDAVSFAKSMRSLPKPALAYCRTGTRAAILWALSEGADGRPLPEILQITKQAGYDMTGVVRRIANGGKVPTDEADRSYDIVIIGGGAGGIAAASSLLSRAPDLDIAIIDPADIHYYQPGWTMVGGGVFEAEETAKTMASLIPPKTHWIKAAVAAFEPENNAVILEGCRVVKYNRLIIAAGLKLNWNGIEGLVETLGRNGVTSNYRYDLAPYTWELVSTMKKGRALFTQPPMPIKCAGAPQKAMYLSADNWYRNKNLKDINVEFYNTGPVLFGVADYVPALMKYIERYNIKTNFQHNLIKIDGPAKTAWFKKTDADGNSEIIETKFDMIHVVPPQTAPDFIRASSLTDSAGWIDVDPETLQHKTHKNIWSIGDVMNAPNAKTAAAVRKQAPIVANNILHQMGRLPGTAHYDGYGSCPLTVERGKIVLAEFGYGGKLLPSFPSWFINGKKPSRLAWFLKETILPPIYWKAMLRGKEWMAEPDIIK